MKDLVITEGENAKGHSWAISQLSIDICLAILGLGADSKQRAQLFEYFGVTAVDELEKVLESGVYLLEGEKLKGAAAIFVDKTLTLIQKFKDVVSQHAGVLQIDFKKHQAAADEIDSWIDERAGFDNMIAKEDITDDMGMGVVSALRYKDSWKLPFRKADTKNRDFAVSGRRVTQIPTMAHTGYMKYFKTSDAEMGVELPMEGGGVVQVWTGNPSKPQFTEARVDLNLPKFGFTHDVELVALLKQIGLDSLFEWGFDGIVSRRRMKLGVAKHRVHVEFNEDGVSAEAATVLLVLASSTAMPRPEDPAVEIHFNAPFQFAILESGLKIVEGYFDGTL